MQSVSSIPVFILAGGLGTRISEETGTKPKPMIEIGEIPVLVHIMRSYYQQGFNDFVICAGYRSWEIKNFFLNYEFRMNHLLIDHRDNASELPTAFGRSVVQEKWRVRVLDTGLECMTGARVARAFDMVSTVQKIDQFALTYGDGLCDVNLQQEFLFHQKHEKIGTVLGVSPPGRFGVLGVKEDGRVEGFIEKPVDMQDVINGGFFFFNRSFRSYLSSDASCVLEREPMERLARDEQLMTFKHNGFWHPMDTLRDKTYLEKLWNTGKAPWSVAQSAETPVVASVPKNDFVQTWTPPVSL